MTEAPDRPAGMDPVQLGFRRQRAVRWFAPRELARVAVKVALSSTFGAYADKRELQEVFPATVPDHAAGTELWLDYVSDVGDSFDATYTVAWLLAAQRLAVGAGGHQQSGGGEDAVLLPRGELLVLGGDEVYPSASAEAYEDRTTGPYQAALPVPPSAPPPTLYALPGNHDWYDGLTAFLRVFAQGARIGGWQTRQTRSYFAMQLPHGWWLFGIDIQFNTYLDAGQLRYFHAACSRVQPGDGIILCTARPSWRRTAEDPEAFSTLDYFERHVVRPTGASVRLWLSGDDHHYARYAEVGGERQLITCGTGGAFTAATHTLPRTLEIPPAESRARRKTAPPARYRLAATAPSRAASARLAVLGVWRLPWRNPSFVFFQGAVHLLLLLSVLSALATLPGTTGGYANGLLRAGWGDALSVLTRPLPLIAAVTMVAAAVGLAYPTRHRPVQALGVLHGLAQVALGLAALLAWRRLPGLAHLPDLLVVAVVAAGTVALTGFVASELVAGYLLLASQLRANVTELFSAQRLEDDKGFLRLHIGPDGVLSVYPVGVRRICRSWTPDPSGAPGDPWLRPAGAPPVPHLIEPPIRVTRGAPVAPSG